jgi:hypothetical protein
MGHSAVLFMFNIFKLPEPFGFLAEAAGLSTLPFQHGRKYPGNWIACNGRTVGVFAVAVVIAY